MTNVGNKKEKYAKERRQEGIKEGREGRKAERSNDRRKNRKEGKKMYLNSFIFYIEMTGLL